MLQLTTYESFFTKCEFLASRSIPELKQYYVE